MGKKTKAELRMEEMERLLQTTDEIEVGDIENIRANGMIPEEILALAKFSPVHKEEAMKLCPGVEEIIDGGLTGRVFRIRSSSGDCYALKVVKEIAVGNAEGQASFIVELLRRRDFERLNIDGVVETIYASRHKGFALSKWINGGFIGNKLPDNGGLNKAKMASCLRTILEMELNGLFDWDINTGNVLYEGDKAWLFDFGYIYEFDPCKEFNPNGTDQPFFSMFERYRDNHVLHYTTRLERNGYKELAYELYRDFIGLLPKLYEIKIDRLCEMHADDFVIKESKMRTLELEILFAQQEGLREELMQEQYIIDKYYSYKTTIEDNRHGNFFDDIYFVRCREMTELLQQHYNLLKKRETLMWGDEELDLADLITKYYAYITDVKPTKTLAPAFEY